MTPNRITEDRMIKFYNLSKVIPKVERTYVFYLIELSTYSSHPPVLCRIAEVIYLFIYIYICTYIYIYMR